MLAQPQHPQDTTLLAYLMDELDAEGSRALEAHVGECPHCALRLRKEAQLEEALFQAAELALPTQKLRRWPRIAAVTASVVAIAAALILSIGTSHWVDVLSEDAGEDAGMTEVASSNTGSFLRTGGCAPMSLPDEDHGGYEGCGLPPLSLALATYPDDEAFGGLADDPSSQLCSMPELACLPGEPVAG